MSKAAKKFNAGELVTMLRDRFSDARRYSVFEQVSNGTGARASSWIDAVVVSLWPSDGCVRAAFEVKVSRADFINELQRPAKNGWARKYCHEFWFVAPSDVIKEEELPEGVGWLCPRGGVLSIKRHASRRESAELSNTFVASLCRSASKEFARKSESIRSDVLESDEGYAEAKRWQEAGVRYVREGGQSWGKKDEYDQLKSVTADKETKEDRAHFDKWVSEWQSRIQALFVSWVSIAHLGLLERDEAGQFIHSHWGSKESEELAMSIAGKERNARAKKILNYCKGEEGIIDLARELAQFLEVRGE